MAASICTLVDVLRDGSSEAKLAAVADMINSAHDNFDMISDVNVCEAVELLSVYGRVPPLPDGEETELSVKDFAGVADKAVIVFKCLHLILEKYWQKFRKGDLLSVFILCSQYNRPSKWSDQSSVKESHGVQKLMLSKWNASDVCHYLVGEGDDTRLLKKLSSSYTTHLTAANWKCNPAMKLAFQQCLFHIRHPFCVDVLDTVLPPSLLFVDDFIVENRIDGIRCLHHILNNTPVGDLQRNGRAELIYSALKNVIYHRDPTVVTVIYPCLLKVLAVTQENPQKVAPIRRVNQYDFLLQHLLKEMNMEQTIALRIAFSSHLPLFINIMGLTVLRHLKTMLNVLIQYLEVYDDPKEITRINCLHSLECLIEAAHPRIGCHLLRIVKGIIRLLYVNNDSKSNEIAKIEIRRRSISCLKLLHRFYPSEIEDMCRPLLSITDQIPSMQIINSIWKVDNKENES